MIDVDIRKTKGLRSTVVQPSPSLRPIHPLPPKVLAHCARVLITSKLLRKRFAASGLASIYLLCGNSDMFHAK